MGYLGHGEGLVVHVDACGVAQRLHHKDSERFISVEWADEPVRTFETGLLVAVRNDKGVLARVAATLAGAEADITHVEMPEDAAQDAIELRFVVAVQDRTHLDNVLRTVRRTPSVLKAARILAACMHAGLRHVVAAHLSEQNNRPALARAALGAALGTAGDDVVVADPSTGFDWLSLR